MFLFHRLDRAFQLTVAALYFQHKELYFLFRDLELDLGRDRLVLSEYPLPFFEPAHLLIRQLKRQHKRNGAMTRKELPQALREEEPTLDPPLKDGVLPFFYDQDVVSVCATLNATCPAVRCRRLMFSEST
jgi:hypothetical protein